MKIKQITETTTAGAIATTETALGGTQSRGNPSIYGGKKVGSLFKGKKTKAPYANSVNESAEISETDLSEQDLIVLPGQGRSKRTGLVPHDSKGNVFGNDLSSIDPDDQGDMEGSFVKNQIHTMLRVLSHLENAIGDDEDLPEWVQMKLSQAQQSVVGVMDYMISDKEREVERQTGQDSLMKEQGVAEAEDLKFNNHAEYINWLKSQQKPKSNIGGWIYVSPTKQGHTAKYRNLATKQEETKVFPTIDELAKWLASTGTGFDWAGYSSIPKMKNELLAAFDKYENEKKGIAEGTDNVDSLVTDTEAVMRTFKMDATQELITKALKIVLGEREYKDRPGYYYSFIKQIIARSKQQGLAEGYDPVESDYQQWEDILVKDGYRGDPSGAHALKLVVGNQLMSDPAEVASTIRNILAYIKQNRQVLSKAVSDRKTVKDAIIDIKNKFPQQYQAAQQPHGVAEGTLREISTNLLRQAATVAADKEDKLRKSRYQNHADYQLAVQKGENPDYNQAALRNKDLHAKRLRALDQTNKFTNAADLKSGNLKNHNLTYAKQRGEELKKGTLGRLRTGDYDKKASEIDKDAPWYNRPVWFPDNQQGVAEGKRNLKCVCKTHGTMQCPVHTPKDIEVIEGAKVDRMVKHVAQSEKKLGHSKKEAENIAWATANKRGMLDNKNKKA